MATEAIAEPAAAPPAVQVAAPMQKPAAQSFAPAMPAEKENAGRKEPGLDLIDFQAWLYQGTLVLSALALVATLFGMYLAGRSLLSPMSVFYACVAATAVGIVSTMVTQWLVAQAFAEAKIKEKEVVKEK